MHHAPRKIQAMTYLGIAILMALAAIREGNFRIINTAELKKLVDEQASGITVIDARSSTEYQEVHIQGAINIPEKRFDEMRHLLPVDKTKTIVFYGDGIKGGKSKKSAVKARDLGYGDILLYAEGMPVWEEKGMAIERGEEK